MAEDDAARRDLERHQREIDRLWELKASKADLTSLTRRVDDQDGQVRANTRAVIAFGFGLATTAVGIAATVVLVTGGHP